MSKLLISISLVVLGINFSYSQNTIFEKEISLHLKNASITTTLKEISKQTNYYFTYNPELIPKNKNFTFSYDKISLAEAIKIIFKDQNLKIELVKNHIVIYNKNQTTNPIVENKKSTISGIELTGEVTDSQTKKPIPFVSVGIRNTTIGIVTNESGEFTVKIPEKFNDSTVYILHIGYKNYSTPVKTFTLKHTSIELEPNIISLQEVIIRNKDPLAIIKSSIANIKDNYIQDQSFLRAFYREGITKKDNFISFSEAVISIRKSPYKVVALNEKIKVDKSRKIINAEETDTLFLKLEDGLYTGLLLDIVKNPIDFFEEESLNLYKYNVSDIVTYDNRLTTVISFEQREDIRNNLYKGRLFIDSESFALISTEFEVDFKYDDRINNFVVKKDRKFKVKPLSAKYIVSYKKIGDKYMLNHVRADLEFKVRKKKDAFSSKYKIFLETAVVDVDFESEDKISRDETLKRRCVFIDNNYTYDSGFWGELNFIKPEQSIKDALHEINVKLNYSN